MARLTWKSSNETVLFDTPDGDLGIDEYAEWDARHWVMRKEPKDIEGCWVVNKADLREELFGARFSLEGKKLVSMTPGMAAYSIYELPDGKPFRVREADDLVEKQRTVKDNPLPVRIL